MTTPTSFPRGHWSFFGPGDEEKWYGTCNFNPEGNQQANQMIDLSKSAQYPRSSVDMVWRSRIYGSEYVSYRNSCIRKKLVLWQEAHRGQKEPRETIGANTWRVERVSPVWSARDELFGDCLRPLH